MFNNNIIKPLRMAVHTMPLEHRHVHEYCLEDSLCGLQYHGATEYQKSCTLVCAVVCKVGQGLQEPCSGGFGQRPLLLNLVSQGAPSTQLRQDVEVVTLHEGFMQLGDVLTAIHVT